MNKLVIQNTEGKWLLNGKTFEELTPEEKNLLNDFFKHIKEIS